MAISTQKAQTVDLKNYFSTETESQILMMRDAILRNQLPDQYLSKLDEICNPCRPQATVEEIMNLMPLPSLTEPGNLLKMYYLCM